jgi:hypothetical protein
MRRSRSNRRSSSAQQQPTPSHGPGRCSQARCVWGFAASLACNPTLFAQNAKRMGHGGLFG